jgi:hypothetical protein
VPTGEHGRQKGQNAPGNWGDATDNQLLQPLYAISAPKHVSAGHMPNRSLTLGKAGSKCQHSGIRA